MDIEEKKLRTCFTCPNGTNIGFTPEAQVYIKIISRNASKNPRRDRTALVWELLVCKYVFFVSFVYLRLQILQAGQYHFLAANFIFDMYTLLMKPFKMKPTM